MRLAEGALYRAKRSGRNRCVVYSSFVDAPLSLQEEADRARTAGLANTVYALARAVDLKDGYTHQHSARVAQYAAVLAREMGMSEEEIDQIRTAGILHDVGKVGVADAVLLKPARLTDDEFLEMQRHSALGRDIIEGAGLADIAEWVLYLHERWDGRGYPEKLAGDDIPLASRVLGVADAFEAMTSSRLYRRGMPVEKALTELEKSAGAQFDPQVAQRMVDLVRAGAIPLGEIGVLDVTHYGSAASSESAAPPEEEGEPVTNVSGDGLPRPRAARRQAGRPRRRQRLERAGQLRELIAAQAAQPEVVVPAHRGAPAQELLDLALVLVALALALPQSADALVLGEGLDGLARRRAEVVSGRLEPPVVEPAAVAELLEHLRREPEPGAAQDRGGQARAPGREHRRERLAEQRADLGEREHPVGGRVVGAGEVVPRRVVEHAVDVVLRDELVARVEAEDRRHGREREQPRVRGVQVRPEAVGEAQDGDDLVRVALGEGRDGALGLDDVALDRRARRVRPRHLLGEVRRVVLLAAVVVRRGLEDDLAHGRVRPAAGGEDVHRPDDVVLVGLAAAGHHRVDDQPRVDHGVDRARPGRSGPAARAGCRRGRTPCA